MQAQSLLGCALLIATSGCVSLGKYDAAVADGAKARAALEAQRRQSTRLAADNAAREQEARERAFVAARELEASRETTSNCRRELDDAILVNQELYSQLGRLGKDAEELLAAKGTLAVSLEQARARLQELRKAQLAAEARSALFRELALKLKHMIDAGDLQIVLRSGRMVLVLPNDVLFDSGRATVKPTGKETLTQVGTALATFRERRFQVSGHTDDEPIRFSGFASNWQLSTERALAVVGLLAQSGMQPSSLSAAGYGEFDPVASNETLDGKARNRRIEITLQPNIDEMVAVPTTQK